MDNYWTLKSAVDFCESFGLVVFDKDKLKNLQYTTGTIKREIEAFSGHDDYIERQKEKEAFQSITQQLKDSNFIQVTEWEDAFCKFKRWKLKVVE